MCYQRTLPKFYLHSECRQFNLGWKLSLVIKGFASSTLLDSYTSERLPVIASMLDKTTSLMAKTFTSSINDADSAFKRGHEMAQLGVNYRGSEVIVDDSPQAQDPNEAIDPYRSGEDGQVRAGDRAPDAPELLDVDGKTHFMFDLFKTTYHIILVFSSSPELIQKVFDAVRSRHSLFKKVVVLPKGTKLGQLGSWENVDYDVLEDSQGHAYVGYNIEGKGLPVIIIRPDGWIGATVANEEGVQRYLKLVFTADA